MVAAIPQVGSVSQTVLVRKITIEETAPAVSFTLAPATLALVCGSTSPQTFTVTNVNGTPGVTAYNWNLGATPNGWLYNGSPAPATIQTSVKTLTLTPVCQSAHSNISVSVTAGGQNYPAANISTVTTAAPVYSISGDGAICSGVKTYTLNTLPCGASVSWTSSNPGLASVSSSGNPVTLTRNGSGNGTVVISGTITGSCGTASISKTIAVGTQATPYLYADWDNPLKIIVGADPVDGATSFKWYVNNVYIKSTTYYNTSLPYNGSCNSNVTVSVEVVNSCGTSSKTNTNIGMPPCGDFYLIAPNPARDILTVTADEKPIVNTKSGMSSLSDSRISQVKIFNSNGVVLKSIPFEKAVRQAKVNVSDLESGLYFIEVSNGNIKRIQKIVIAR